MTGRRTWAASALACAVAAVVVLAVNVLRSPLAAAAAAGLLVAAAAAGEAGVRRRGTVRVVAFLVALGLLLAAALMLMRNGSRGEGVVLGALVALMLLADRRALDTRADLPAARRPTHPVMVWNARSGGGKAVTHHLADEARARGIEPLELTPGTDLLDLVHDAVARGADALAAAGGDGTQALVATVAAEKGLPFACIPAGTRNHFALDLGVDRDDVVGALDALVDGRERVVDLAEINGRVFVNNCSLGVYAVAVQRKGYRDAKLRTILDTAPDVMGPDARADGDLQWTGPDGADHSSAAVILVSNNAYRLGSVVGAGTRPRLDEGRLGVAVLRTPADRASSAEGGRKKLWLQWRAGEFDLGSSHTIPVGVDGEALALEPPLHFVSRPGALRVLIAPHHPGASPTAYRPATLSGTVALLWRIALGRQASQGHGA